MKKEDLYLVIGLIVILGAVVIGFSVVKSMSGVDPPFTVIESQSMQHSENSEIGIIDTGDMILVKSPDKTNIVTLVEGYATGEQHFGDYGSVIVYKRDIGNPVIHRAIIYLEYNSASDSWSAPSLENYNLRWSVIGVSDPDVNDLHGTLIIDLPGDYRSVNSVNSVHINLDVLNHKSGYVTMGDNNQDIDQNSSNISFNTLVSKDKIKSVAWKEVPWLGAIKLIANGKIDNVTENVPNTIPNLITFIVTIILILFSIGYVYDINKSKKERDTPTPPFPLEQEKE